jgi:hypothetical protein
MVPGMLPRRRIPHWQLRDAELGCQWPGPVAHGTATGHAPHRALAHSAIDNTRRDGTDLHGFPLSAQSDAQREDPAVEVQPEALATSGARQAAPC